MPNITEDVMKKAAQVKLLLMDVDGVLTNGTMYYVPGPSGAMVETKGFSSRDGLGFHMLHAAGLSSGVISGLDSPAVNERARILGIAYVYQGHLNKLSAYDEILAKAKLTSQQVCFIGDDFTDCVLIHRSGLGVAVANSSEELKPIADYVTAACGGAGAVREVIELILKSQGLWQTTLERYGI